MTITPRTLKGFRDFPPEQMIPREAIIETAKRVYRSYGYSPIDTPALEYLEILTGKGGEESDRLMYQFEDHGGRKVGLRFDLTVPLARFAAQHIQELGTPFKRYHIGLVWRGENTHRGRYREFMQCDFDAIGVTSPAADIETALVIHDLFQAIGFENFQIRVNNRQLLAGLLEMCDLQDQAGPVLRALDKLAKIGAENVSLEMQKTAGATPKQAESVLRLAQISGNDNQQIITAVRELVAKSEIGRQGLEHLAHLLEAVQAAGVPADRIRLDLSIARGLDYYTGVVFETFLEELPEIGSVCSGGRYDNLARMYSNQSLPGVGASLGLDRLLAAMEELGRIESVRTPAPVFIPFFDGGHYFDYLRLAARLRQAGLGVEVYPQAKKLGQQLKYADRRGFRVALIMGENEFSTQTCQVKDLQSGQKHDVSMADDAEAVLAKIQQILHAGS